MVASLCATKMRAPMWCEGVPAGVCVFNSLNDSVVCYSIQGRGFAVVGVGGVSSLLRCIGGDVDVRVQMWAAGAAADHSSARVHDVIALSGHFYVNLATQLLLCREYIDTTHISMQLNTHESDDGNNAGHLEWVMVLYRANIDNLAQIGIDSCISQGTFS